MEQKNKQTWTDRMWMIMAHHSFLSCVEVTFAILISRFVFVGYVAGVMDSVSEREIGELSSSSSREHSIH